MLIDKIIHIPWKYHKTMGFLMFQGVKKETKGMKWEKGLLMSILTNCTLIWCANTGKANLWTSIKLWQLSQKKLLYLINMRLGYQTHVIIKFDHNVTAKKKRATWLTLFFLQKLSAGALAILLLRSFMVASKKRHTVGHGEMWMIYNLYSKLSPGWCKKLSKCYPV